jgi:Fur family ferric uptake transcriptional regulator
MSPCHTLIEELRKQGYRLTPQREMIVEAVAHAGRHVTAEEVYEQVRTRTSAVNVATVYRTLDLLVELGLISRADLGDGRVTYASPLHGPHCHLVCRRCGYVIEADYELVAPLDERLRDQYCFVADLDHLAIPGLCADCEARLSRSVDEE